jgi:hypothetical protein
VFPSPTGWYRDIRANAEQTRNPVGLDQCEGDHPRRREEPFWRSGMLLQKWLQRWTRSVISPGSVTRQEGARWTSRIPAVYLGRTRRSATPAVGLPGPSVPVLPVCRYSTVSGSAMTLQVRRHDKVSEPHRRMGSCSLSQAVPPIGAAGRCGRLDESVGKGFPQRLGNPVAAEATAGILRGTSRSGRRRRPTGHPGTAR